MRWKEIADAEAKERERLKVLAVVRPHDSEPPKHVPAGELRDALQSVRHVHRFQPWIWTTMDMPGAMPFKVTGWWTRCRECRGAYKFNAGESEKGRGRAWWRIAPRFTKRFPFVALKPQGERWWRLWLTYRESK